MQKPNRLKSLRQSAGMTQMQIAERCGISQQHYAQIEQGNRNMTAGVREAIARALGVKAYELFAEPRDRTTDDERTLLAAFRTLDAADRDIALSFLDALAQKAAALAGR